MQCEKFEFRLNQLLDERRPAERDDQLLAHASACSDCQQMLATQQLLFDALLPDSESPDSSASPGVESPEALAERVLQTVTSNPFPVVPVHPVPVRPVESQPMLSRLAWLAAAIVLIAGVSSAFQFITGDTTPVVTNDTRPADDSPSDKSETITSNGPTDDSPSTRPTLDEDHYRQMAKTWGESVASGVMQISAADGEAIDAQMGQFKSLRPLRVSMAAAFDALRKTLPHIAQPNDDQAS